MAARHRSLSERGQLDLFRALPGDFAPRDAQDLMAFPFFSLSKSHRVAPIDFTAGEVTIRVESVPDHGMATIWDADILIWAASQIVEARDAGLRTSRLMAATPYEILRFIGRGTSLRDYQRLKAALDRLQSTTVCTSIRQPAEGRRHRFSWINEWKERIDRNGRPDGIEMILPDWFYQAVIDDALILTIDRAYFDLAGGLERWLYRIVRKHGGRQRKGWRFDFRHLHQKSGALSPFKRFAFELRDIIRLPTVYRSRDRWPHIARLRAFSTLWKTCGWPRAIGNPQARAIGNRPIVPTGTQTGCNPICHNEKSRP
jgi:plasmid replication initiation protein